MTLGFSPLGSTPLAGAEGASSAAVASYIATGIAPTTGIGTPVATSIALPVYSAAGIAPTTAFGTPSTPTTAFTVTGIQPAYARSTRVGKPARLLHNYAPSASYGVRVGNPKAVTTGFTCFATGIALSTLFGQAASLAVVHGKAGTIGASKVGTPTCQFTQLGYVSGFKSTRFGQPRVPLAPFDLSLHVVKRERRLYARVS